MPKSRRRKKLIAASRRRIEKARRRQQEKEREQVKENIEGDAKGVEETSDSSTWWEWCTSGVSQVHCILQ